MGVLARKQGIVVRWLKVEWSKRYQEGAKINWMGTRSVFELKAAPVPVGKKINFLIETKSEREILKVLDPFFWKTIKSYIMIINDKLSVRKMIHEHIYD